MGLKQSRARAHKKLEKQKNSHKSLTEFYSDKQIKDEAEQTQKHAHKKKINDTEMEIFEHLKNHTKKILKKS